MNFARNLTWTTAVAAGVWTSLVPLDAPAVILRTGHGNLAPPADDPGFTNVSNQGSSQVYLGDSWVLTALHTGVPSQAHFAGESYDVIPNTAVALHNPEELGLTSLTDLRMFRIDGNPDLPSLDISASPPPVGAEIVMIGRGRDRQDDLTHWDVQINGDRWVWTQTSGWGDYRGFKITGGSHTRWGTDRIEDDFKVTGERDWGHTSVVSVGGGGGRDVVSLLTLWDETGDTTHEAQAVAGDSGGGVFYKRGNQWELAGIMNAVLVFPVQRRDWSIFGQSTVIADLSTYRDEILSIMDTPNYSIMGDINLDGVVSGNGTGPPESDDLAAFITGWMTEHASPNVDSWKMGDLNQDAVTNLHDFQLLRSALPNASSATAALGIPPGASIPEPSTWILLAISGTGLSLLRRRFRRHRSGAGK